MGKFRIEFVGNLPARIFGLFSRLAGSEFMQYGRLVAGSKWVGWELFQHRRKGLQLTL